MNEPERLELERLKRRQAQLQTEMNLLASQLTSLEQKLTQARAPEPTPFVIAKSAPAQPEPPVTKRETTKPIAPLKPIPVAPPPIPPIIPPAPVVPKPTPTPSPAAQEFAVPEPPAPIIPAVPQEFLRKPQETAPVMAKGSCRNCSGHLEFPAATIGDTVPCPHCGQSTLLTTAPAPEIPIAPPLHKGRGEHPREPAFAQEGRGEQPLEPALAPLASRAAAQPKGSLEMRVGTYWLVRIGVVMVVTGLVFFANLAYKNYISKLGPGGKLSLLYVASFALLGAGTWWQRKPVKESLKNYAQVLFAGGLAAVYFTTYAGYYIEPLRFFKTPALDGALLLAWAGFMVWIADRKKSEVLAFFAVGLGYYSSIITRVGFFTLYSNLVLTAAAVTFLLRNRWAVLTFASLCATYAAYTFWRFFNGTEWRWASPEEGLWTGTYFLISYWLLFTAAVFFSKHEKFSGPNRAAFLTLNNGSFFALFLLTMFQVRQGGLWKFTLIYGSALLLLSELARLFLAKEPMAKNSYLTQGLLLVTTGFILKFSGMNLALILAVESVTLLLVGQQRNSRLILAAAHIAAVLAVGWGIDGLRQSDKAGAWLGAGLGASMMFNTFLSHRKSLEQTSPLRASPACFTVLAMVAWLAATWDNTSHQNFPLVLSAEAVVLILSIYLLRIREASLLAQGYLALAQAVWVGQIFFTFTAPPWWHAALMLSIAIAVDEWWHYQKLPALRFPDDANQKAFYLLPQLAKNVVFIAGANLAVILAGGWDILHTNPSGSNLLYPPIVIGALIFADVLLAHRRTPIVPGVPLRLQPAFSTGVALFVCLAVTWHHTARSTFPLVIAAEGLLLTFSFYLVRVREIPLLSQGLVLLAQIAWVVNALTIKPLPPWWNPLLLIAITVALSHWWQKQKTLAIRAELCAFWQGLYALSLVGVLYCWLSLEVSAPTWLALTSLLAVGLTVYGVLTRSWWLAAFGQIFILVSGVQFLWQVWQTKPSWMLPLAPVAALVLLSAGTLAWFSKFSDTSPRVRQPLLQIALVYRWVALAMSLCWVWQYIPARERMWLLSLLGLWFFLFAGWRRGREALITSAVYTFSSLFLFWVQPVLDIQSNYWPNLGAIIVLLIQRQLARRLPERYPLEPAIHNAAMLIGGLSLWLFLSRFVLDKANGELYLTASWSVLALALFAVGIALRERMYRWLGLGILACALGRIGIIDVWRLELVYRVLSFMAIGIVLLVLGFIYNKYQEKLKEWL
jgi:hypothetical protein